MKSTQYQETSMNELVNNMMPILEPDVLDMLKTDMKLDFVNIDGETIEKSPSTVLIEYGLALVMLSNQRSKMSKDGSLSFELDNPKVINSIGSVGGLMPKKLMGELFKLYTTYEMDNEYKTNKKERVNKYERGYHNKMIKALETSTVYQFKESEKMLSADDPDRLDILCQCKVTKRPVIIELKRGNKSAHKQLRSYAIHFDNPILINVSETLPAVMREGILYMTYKDFGI